jgi:hypothetical protein
MTLYALDPGTEQSAVVTIDRSGGVAGRMWDNRYLVIAMRGTEWFLPGQLVIEEIASYGMPVGREVFATVQWSGRFIEAWDARGFSSSLLPRKAVKLALCGSLKAKDANIRQALIDRYGGPACIKKGGALYGIKSHLWAALALAVAYQEQDKP